ncbi:MAG: hydroxylase [Oscillatoriales cyanobacterium RM2_1_1]|nr:hydroxylase [Oscillatoriales cyanobacterium RM2_1_1]
MVVDPNLIQQFDGLVSQSFETLASLLQDSAVPAQERAEIAFKILELAGVSPEKLTAIVPSQSVSQNSLQHPYYTLHQKPSQNPAQILAQTSKDSASASLQIPKSSLNKTKAVPYSTQTVIQTESFFLPGDYVHIDNFLSEQNNQEILEIALSKSDQFVSSTTTTRADNYRQSSILYATLFPDFYELMRNQLLAALPATLAQLRIPNFPVAQVEMQLTAHNDGCFYKIHNDSGSAETLTRTITYVYYFYQEPKQFSGGELRLYETEFQAGCAIAPGKFRSIEPRNNSIVLFDSRCKHEVMPVICPSRKFDHSRFTLNGWFRRQEAKLNPD